jgi:hypothetical protein
LTSFRSCGHGRLECVVYLVGPVDSPETITNAVHPVHASSARHYEVDGAWLTQFWLDLRADRTTVKTQVHTHGGRASHSKRDDDGALVYRPGFLSLVLPGFGLDDNCLDGAFLAELDDEGIWQEVALTERLQWT